MARVRRRRPRQSQIPDFRRVLRRVAAIAIEENAEAVREFTEVEKDRFVRNIEQQAFASFQEVLYPESGTNLSPAWLKLKEQAGADMRTMIATTNYVSRIRVFETKQRKPKGVHFFVGFGPNDAVRDLKGRRKQVQLPGSSIRGLRALQFVHEYGTIDGRVPQRPHWGPHKEQMKAKAPVQRKKVKKRIKDRLKSELRGKVVVR